MASNILSRLLPSTSDDDDAIARPPSDLEGHAGLDDLDSEPHFEDQDLEQLLQEGMMDEMDLAHRTESVSDRDTRQGSRPPHHVSDDDDDDVPESLLLEPRSERSRKRRPKSGKPSDDPEMAVPGPSTRKTRLQWETTRAQQQLHKDLPRQRPRQLQQHGGPSRTLVMDPKQKALWLWANVENLDQFLRLVYYYYEEHGIWSIALRRTFSLLTSIFVFTLASFTFFCIDYSKLPGSTKLSDVKIEKCMSKVPGYWNLFTWAYVFTMVFLLIRFVRELPGLWDMHNFYHHLLDIPDKDIQTVSWQYVISKLMELRDANPNTAANISPNNRKFMRTQSKQRMDAHDINNRLMRRENYWISLINKEVMDCSLEIPFLGKRSFYSRSLELMISICLMDFVFDENCQVKQEFRNSKKRDKNIALLRKRFQTAAILSACFCIPIAIWAMLLRFLTSFAEYQKNPSDIGTRKFSLLAEWKMRELNEVSHHFQRRKRMASQYANRYLDQFPKDKMNQLFRFAAFIPGALLAVLGVVTMWDPDLFLGFEIWGRTALFWVGALGTLYVGCRNAASNEDDDIWDPETAMQAVIANTHYCPDSWSGRLYSEEVRQEFVAMYKLEVLLFLEDVAAMIITPLILTWSLPTCAPALVDFFREFTIEIDGLGTVCSFAVFPFKTGGKAAPRPGGNQADELREDYYGDKANKMLASYMSFLDHYGPNPKRGISSRKRAFHPPPTFPGIMHNQGFAEPSGSGGRYGSGLGQSVRQTPRLGPAGSHVSPMHSILLDPHHQPRMSPRQGPTRRTERSRAHVLEDDPLEAEEDDSPAKTARGRHTSSNLLIEDSELGDSWLKGGDPIEDESPTRGADHNEPRTGVLGMLMEIRDAQTERRGGHV